MALKILHPHTRSQRAAAGARAGSRRASPPPSAIPASSPSTISTRSASSWPWSCARAARSATQLARGPLPPAQALARAGELFATLAAVHARGVVHGDVKPANLLFRDAGDDAELVLGDFGLAQLVADGDEERAARGTLAYMAPEQRRGAVAPAADVYAAGVILVELLAGTAALAPWLGDRAALLRGEARWSGALPVERRAPSRRARRRAARARSRRCSPTTRPLARRAAAAAASLDSPSLALERTMQHLGAARRAAMRRTLLSTVIAASLALPSVALAVQARMNDQPAARDRTSQTPS